MAAEQLAVGVGVGFYLGDEDAPEFSGAGAGNTLKIATRKALWALYEDTWQAFDQSDLTDQGRGIYISLKHGLKGPH